MVPVSPLERKQAHRAIHWPWSRSVKTGVWLRALGNGDQRRPMGRKARDELYVYVFFYFSNGRAVVMVVVRLSVRTSLCNGCTVANGYGVGENFLHQ